MNDYLDANRKLWDDLTDLHAASKFYDMDGFIRGDNMLIDIDREEIGDVSGKSILHLQCHFGLDTLSLARMGAEVTGADFSEKAISLATSIAARLNISSRFVCCSLYDLPGHLTGEFDMVFSTAGVLCWLPDLRRWAEVIAHFIRKGGALYLREFHPFVGIFDDEAPGKAPTLRYPYFPRESPMRFEDCGDYADPTDRTVRVSYEWSHSMESIINSLIEAGLRIEHLHEFPFSTYASHPFLVEDEEVKGRWRCPSPPGGLPLMFTIRAVKG